MDPITFFNKANELMVKNSPTAADKEMLEKIAAVNIGPGMEFDTSVLTGDVILSEDAPKDTTNWLPVGAGGFHLFMRIYTPDMDALETWVAPTITEIYPSNEKR